MSKIIRIETTFPDRKSALAAAKALVTKNLAACAQVGSRITSTYKWHAKTEVSAEYPLYIKTSKKSLKNLKAEFRKLHPYECPEWIQFECEASAEYAAWVEKSTQANANKH